MDPIVVRQGDDRPSLIVRFKDIEADKWIDLSDASVSGTAKLRKKGTTTVLQTVVLTKLFGGATGYMRFDWPAAALDVDAGDYELEFALDFSTGAGTDLQTAVKYSREEDSGDYDVKSIPVKVKEDF